MSAIAGREQAEREYAQYHRATSFAIDSDDGVDMVAMVAKVDRDIANLAQVTLAPPILVDKDEPVAYDGFGAPLYAHQISAEGTE